MTYAHIRWNRGGDGRDLCFHKNGCNHTVSLLPIYRSPQHDDGHESWIYRNYDGERWLAYNDGRVLNFVSLYLVQGP